MRRPRMSSICLFAGGQKIGPAKAQLVGGDRAPTADSFSSARPMVDLPEPDSPTMPSRSRPSWKETPRTAST